MKNKSTKQNKNMKTKTASDGTIFRVFSGANGNYVAAEDNKKTYEELYGEVNRLEKLLYDTDTAYMVWLVKNRNTLWT